MMKNIGIINAGRAWGLLKNRKVEELGFEPCLFVPGDERYPVICHHGWFDGGQHLDGDTEYKDEEFDKGLFVRTFLSQYPQGIVIGEDYRDYLVRIGRKTQEWRDKNF
jgi:hypothetical protein